MAHTKAEIVKMVVDQAAGYPPGESTNWAAGYKQFYTELPASTPETAF